MCLGVSVWRNSLVKMCLVDVPGGDVSSGTGVTTSHHSLPYETTLQCVDRQLRFLRGTRSVFLKLAGGRGVSKAGV